MIFLEYILVVLNLMCIFTKDGLEDGKVKISEGLSKCSDIRGDEGGKKAEIALC